VVQGQPLAKMQDSFQKITKTKKSWGTAQVVKHLLGKPKAQSSNPSTTKKKIKHSIFIVLDFFSYLRTLILIILRFSLMPCIIPASFKFVTHGPLYLMEDFLCVCVCVCVCVLLGFRARPSCMLGKCSTSKPHPHKHGQSLANLFSNTQFPCTLVLLTH
jgi:hypothetical protein